MAKVYFATSSRFISFVCIMSKFYKDDFEDLDDSSDFIKYNDDFEEFEEEKLKLTKSARIIHFQFGDFSNIKSSTNSYNVSTQTDNQTDQSTQNTAEFKDQITQAPASRQWKRDDDKMSSDVPDQVYPADLSSKSYVLDSILSTNALRNIKIPNDLFATTDLFTRKCKSTDSIIYDPSVLGRCFSFINGSLFKSEVEIFHSKTPFVSVFGFWMSGDFYFLATTKCLICKVIKFNPFGNKQSKQVSQLNLPNPLLKLTKLKSQVYFIFLGGYSILDQSALLSTNPSIDFIEYAEYTPDALVSANLVPDNKYLSSLATNNVLVANIMDELPVKSVFSSNNHYFVQTITGDILSISNRHITHATYKPLNLTSWNGFNIVVSASVVQLFDKESSFYWDLQFDAPIHNCQFISYKDHLQLITSHVISATKLQFKMHLLNKDHFDIKRQIFVENNNQRRLESLEMDTALRNIRLEQENKKELKQRMTVYE